MHDLLVLTFKTRYLYASKSFFVGKKLKAGIHKKILFFPRPENTEQGLRFSVRSCRFVLGFVVRLAIAPVSAGLQYLTFFPAVTLAAIFGGFRAGIFATILGSLFATYIFIPPYYTFSIEAFRNSAWSNLVFLIDGVIVSFSISTMLQYRDKYALELAQSKAAHSALAESTQNLKNILDNIFAYVTLLDTDGRVLEINQAAINRGGYRREEVIGKYIFDTPCWSYDDTVWEQIRSSINAAGQGQTLRYDVVVKMRHEFVPLDFQISPVRNQHGEIVSLLQMGIDISKRKQAEERLHKSVTQLHTFINHAPICMAMFDRNMNYQAISGRWLVMGRLSYDDLIGRNVYQVHPDLPERWASIHQRGLAGEIIEKDEDLWIQADGSEHWLHWVVLPWTDEHNAIGGIIIACDDITHRKEIQDRLNEQAKLLQEADRRKDEFLAMLAHELRNPLAPIRNAVQILKKVDSDLARITWCRNVIDRQAEHLIRLVDDLLDVSRINRGLVEIKNEALEIRDFIQPAVETNQPLIDARRQKLSLTLPSEPLWVTGDRVRLTQVVSNLLNNAAKYTETQGNIGLSVEWSGNEVCIRVCDSGCGIDPVDLPHLFDLFYQTERNLDRSLGGLGIGLSIVHDLVKKHGGEIRASSDGLGKGSEFLVRLPRLKLPVPITTAITANTGAIQGNVLNTGC